MLRTELALVVLACALSRGAGLRRGGHFSGQSAQALQDFSVAFARCNGLQVLSEAAKGAAASSTPMSTVSLSLLPMAVPAAAFSEAYALSATYNELVDKVARDGAWLREVLRETAASDDFVRKLLEIDERWPAGDRYMLGVQRSDYMMNGGEGAPKQVELNTVASSFGGLSAKVAALHRQTLRRLSSDPRARPELAAFLRANRLSALGAGEDGGKDAGAEDGDGRSLELPHLPPNEAADSIALGIAAAHAQYLRDAKARDAVVLFVVQEGERNVNDQREVELRLLDAFGVRCCRATLAELADRLEPAGGDGAALLLDGEEVSVTYFRAGYDPADYEAAPQCWDARERLEASSCICCPGVAYQLAGTKKVQQALAAAGGVERFVGDAAGARLRGTFAGLWELGAGASPEAEAAAAAAVASPDDFVVKPQREGGGHNLYGEEAAAALTSMPADQLQAYILMERLRPRPQAALLMPRQDPGEAAREILQIDALHELGVFGIFLGSGAARPIINEAGGHILRAKPVDVDEGGVAAGYACLGSPSIVGDAEEVRAVAAELDDVCRRNAQTRQETIDALRILGA